MVMSDDARESVQHSGRQERERENVCKRMKSVKWAKKKVVLITESEARRFTWGNLHTCPWIST